MDSTASIKVDSRCSKRLLGGHLWVYESDIKSTEGGYSGGDIISVLDSRGKFIGKGFINDRSKIRARILSFTDEKIDAGFFKKRIQNALAHRIFLGFPPHSSFRVVFSEGDLLPGLIVDKYEDVLSVQFTTLGMEQWKGEIIEILKDLLFPSAIIERSDIGVREKEGLKQEKGIIYGKKNGKMEPQKTIKQDGLLFKVDLLEGHKTGFYLDQQDNRRVIKPFVAGKKVLDCFSYSGAFSIYAAAFGATEVVAVEDSGKVMDILRENIMINGFEKKIRTEKGDAFQWMREAYKKDERFDCVMLDPPSFVRGKDARGGALRGYKDINILGLKLLNDGGYLVTSSCSQSISAHNLIEIVKDSASDAACLVQLLEIRQQAKDHPILASMPETHYLNFIIGKKISH
ncbi:MAG: class I SAM-dependent rRNA methyltransferase [Candidatus Schekmanbacteria bacterium]|nr:class I SAM-dependent rRNA methyltransferase [Candidatus Schekmanbacteria bacterium]